MGYLAHFGMKSARTGTESASTPGKGSGIKGRPRRDGLPPIQRGQREVILGKHAPVPAPAKPAGDITEVSFPVEDAGTVRESMDVNGAALVNDAFRRAARAATSGDPFDRAVYLTLLGKTKPTEGKTKLPGTKKQQLRALERIMASMDATDAEYVHVQAESLHGYTPAGATQAGQAG